MRLIGWAIVIIAVCGVGACNSGSSHSSSSVSIPTASSTTVAAATPTSGGPTTTTSGLPATTQNLPVTPAVRQSLVDAGAAHHHLAPSDYTGLRAGDTYYAYDVRTSTYWAAAALAPSAASYQAQVSNQDDGSYLLFTMASGSPWTVYDDGLGGVGGTPCPVTIPPEIVAGWGWTPGACKPPNG
jgi:hypothetical protein